MTLAIEELPNDVDSLKRMIVEIQAEQQATVEKAVTEAVLAILRRYYGPRSERFDPCQLLLFGEQVDQDPLDTASIEAEAGEPLKTRRPQRKSPHGRRPLPEHLERIEIEHDLDNKACPACGNERCRMGEEVSEQLEHFPASLKVLRHIRPKYACGKCNHDGYDPNIETAVKPSQPIEKGLAGPGLLAYVITSKLGDHLPLYRLERIFARQQVHIAISTMCAWMQSAGHLIRPLVDLMTERIKQSAVIHTDDTTVPIQSPGQKTCRKGRIWCYLGDDKHPYVVYDYTPNRKRDGPASWLKGYVGYLQADAYGGYDGVYHTQKVMEVACWAHARRKFFVAQDSDRRRATELLAMVAKLYDIEREAKTLDHAGRLALRESRSAPVLAQIREWLDAERAGVVLRSPMAKAFTYINNQWDALNAYATRGDLAIDNNLAERAMKRVAIGRKNWMFAGNDRAGANHARLWSLVATCERHGVDPQRYLTSVLAKIGQTPADELGQFLPDVWKAEDAAEPVVSE